MTHNVEVVRVIYSTEGFAIFSGVDGNGVLTTYKGNVSKVNPGLKLIITGDFVDDPRYGEQFQIESYDIDVQSGADAIYLYLSSGVIKGCGAKTAKDIVARFGDDALDVIRNDCMRLTSIRGISEAKARKIHDEEALTGAYCKLLSYPGLTPSKAGKLYEQYGAKAADVLTEHPYDIIYDISGFGFKTVDAIALKNGVSPMADSRIGAAITFTLESIGVLGDCYLTDDELIKKLNELIADVPSDRVSRVLSDEIMNGRVISEGDALYAKKVYETECTLAKAVATMVTMPQQPATSDERMLADAIISRLEDQNGFPFEPLQKEAVHQVFDNRLCAITGGAGTGKTTIIKAITAIQTLVYHKEVVLCAPTGKASRRMSEASSHSAHTVHSYVFANAGVFSPGTLVICDESSMLDIYIAEKLMTLIKENGCRVVFVGDAHQLPPVGAGTFFADLLKNRYVPSVELEISHRQHGHIAYNADMINRGKSRLVFDGTTTVFIEADKMHAADEVIKQYCTAVRRYGLDNVCAIAPIRKSGKSQTATSDLNVTIRELLNKNSKPNRGCKFAVGDRVMNLENDAENDIYNGDIGTVVESSAEDNVFVIKKDDGRIIEYELEREQSFDFAYAMSVHKSQGQEYKCVIFACNDEHKYLLERNMLYTAVTRAKEKIIIIGDYSAIQYGAWKQKANARKTKLCDRITRITSSILA